MDPITSFSTLALSPELLLVVQELGFHTLTPIQAKSIPSLLEGKDLIGQSKTGSGKTLAYTLPLIDKLQLAENCVQALVLCPTRELSQQVAREIRKLGRRHSRLKVVTLVGGQPIAPQLRSLESGAHVVVGTPGRVLDHLRRKTLSLGNASLVILDEADRMLDMGFAEEMEEIFSDIPKERQTVFFSATFPDRIASLSQVYQRDPVRVTIDEQTPTAVILQIAFEMAADDKFSALLWSLQEYKAESAIVFCNLKTTVMDLTEALQEAGISAACLHGDLEQSERDRVMAKFRNLSIRILVATDVAARGIDITDLDLVINFDFPKPDVYIHRIGRTGRAGKSGLAISFVEPRELFKIQSIVDSGVTTIQIQATPLFTEMPPPTAIPSTAKMETLFISAGRKEKMRPGDILGALTGEAGGLDGKDVGKIEIHDHFSYVAIARDIAELALQRLQKGRIKGRKLRVEKVR